MLFNLIALIVCLAVGFCLGILYESTKGQTALMRDKYIAAASRLSTKLMKYLPAEEVRKTLNRDD